MAQRRGTRQEREEQRFASDLRHFLIDIGYDEGESYCRALLETGDFGQRLLKAHVERGSKSMSKQHLAGEVARRLVENEIRASDLALAYCQQPRHWLCVRMGTRTTSKWPPGLTATDFLTKRLKRKEVTLYGPFGAGDERWYIIAKNVLHASVNAGNAVERHNIRWAVIAQVNPEFVALHWNNFGVRTQRPDDQRLQLNQYPYWYDIPDFFRTLEDELDGKWDRAKPNLTDLILHGSFDRYSDNEEYEWENKAVRAAFKTVALNASGGRRGNEEERTAKGLQILTEALAKTAITSLTQKKPDPLALKRVEHALLRMILHDWGTKAFQFILEPKTNEEEEEDEDEDEDDAGEGDADATRLGMRMHVYFGRGGEKKPSPDSLQHIRCYGRYGGSSRALTFLLQEMEKERS